MDPEYDTERARMRVEAAATEYDERKVTNVKSVSTIETTDYNVMYVDQPQSWRIINPKEDENIEEMFQIHGVLCASDLPPVESKNVSHLKSKALYLRQFVRLTGLDTEKFETAMSKVDEVFNLINSYMDNDVRLQWEPAKYEGQDALDINARYFTTRKNAPQERGQTFEMGVDPHGILANIRGQDFIHGSDNKVQYRSEYMDNDGSIKLLQVEPSKFHIGDVVRATVSFVGFPSKDKTARMTIVLKALTLIESIPKKSNVQPCRILQKAAVIKRKVVFEDEREVREGIANMTIDDGMKEVDDE